MFITFILRGFWQKTVNKNNDAGLIKKAVEAIKHGQLEALKKILDLGLDPSAKDRNGYSLLHNAIFATETGHETDMVLLSSLLIEAGADVNSVEVNANYTPLHTAVLKKLPHTILLLKYFGAIETQDVWKKIPSQYADTYINRDYYAEAIVAILKINDRSLLLKQLKQAGSVKDQVMGLNHR